MRIEKLLLVAVLPVIAPVLDIAPASILIVLMFFLAGGLCLLSGCANSVERKNFESFYWGGMAALFLFFTSVIGGVLESRGISEHIPYVLRFVIFSSSFFLMLFLVQGNIDRNFLIHRYAIILFWLIVCSAVFEFILRQIDLKPLLYLYKARQDLGGIDTVHYNRFSGFWSFPGDTAAVIVLCFHLVAQSQIRFSRVRLLFLVVLMLLTQSKAGIFFLLLYWCYNYIRPISLGTLFRVCGAAFLISFAFINLNFEYLMRFFDNLDFYLSQSKRAQEILAFVSADGLDMAFGLTDTHGIYESELFGAFNRIGFVGGAYLIILPLFCFYMFVQDKQARTSWFFFMVFFLVYCTISAGMSRFKIFYPYLIFFVILISGVKTELGFRPKYRVR